MVAAVALMAMVSCNKMENNGGEEVVVPTIPFEFTAYASEDAATSAETQQPAMAQKVDTKATLVYDENGKNPKTHWKSTDKINVNRFEFVVDTESEYGAGARFVGKVDEKFGPEYKAVYPSSAGETWDAITVKSTQTAQAGTFDPDALVAVAYSNTDNVLAFKHVTSLLKFQVPAAADFSDKITSVTITSTDALAGTISVKLDDKTPTVEVKNPINSVTVNCEEGFDSDETYYVAVLPGEKNNFEVCINGYISKTAPKVTIARSTIADMKRLPKPVIRVYITTERTHFPMNMYAWYGDPKIELAGTWPGEQMKWDDGKEKYYYDFPYEIKGKQMKYIINNSVYQTADLNATIQAPTYTRAINWKWVYFLPSNNWKDSNPRFAAYFYTQGQEGEYWMKSVGPDDNGVYGYVVPDSKKNVIFVRLNPGNESMSFDNGVKWNQTADLTIPTDSKKNYFKCTEGWWDAHNGEWSTYTLPLN